MTAHTSNIEFDPERIARDLSASLAAALNEIAGRLHPTAHPETGEDRPTDPQITAWPNRTHPPTLIVRCPVCDESVETTPLLWETVIDPTTTTVSVRGLVQHTHEDPDIDARWPFTATWTPPPAKTIAHDPHEDDRADIEEGQEHNPDEPVTFTPDEPDEPVSIRSAVFQALGAASVAWRGEAPQGIFDDEYAVKIGEALLTLIDERAEELADERAHATETARARLASIIRTAADTATRRH